MKNIRWTPLILVILIVTGGYFISRHDYKKTDGFSPKALCYHYPIELKLEITTPPPINRLNQTFTYLGKGARSWAFLGEDGKTVLKFFKGRYLSHPLHPYKKNKVLFEEVLQGYKLAWDADRKGTALLYIHLNPTYKQLPSVPLIDKSGTAHSINLNKIRFVLQEKATPLDSMFVGKNPEFIRSKLMDVLQLYQAHFALGIGEKGVGILKNNGFVGDRPVHFDVGKLQKLKEDDSPKILLAKLVEKLKSHFGSDVVKAIQQKYGAEHYSFLAEGGQSYVYQSDDGKQVLKLLRLDRMQPNWTHFFTSSARIEKRDKKYKRMIEGMQIANKHLKQACGLLEVQIDSNGPSRPVFLTDANGKKRLIDLKDHPFILQKKGVVLSDYLKSLDDAQKQAAIAQVFELYQNMYDKGIVDEDHGVMHNIGFIDGEPFHIDVGRFVKATPEVASSDFVKVQKKLSLFYE